METQTVDLNDMDEHFKSVLGAMKYGRLVIFLGAGANLCNRPPDISWSSSQQEFLPLGDELCQYLVSEFGVNLGGDLARVSQYISLRDGTAPLYEGLNRLFDADFPITPLHRLLAQFPGIMRSKGYPRQQSSWFGRFLVVTTNYDDLMERAFQEAGEEFHKFVYDVRNYKNQFRHYTPEGQEAWVAHPSDHRLDESDKRPVLLKIHGSVERCSQDGSFVVTEEHYIDYLAQRQELWIPDSLASMLRQSSLLFLGYSLKDWNLRVLLHRLWKQVSCSWSRWAIQLNSDPIDREFWRDRQLRIIDHPMAEYVAQLEQRVRAMPDAGTGA